MIKFSETDVFIVTGASSGIGEAVAVLLNELGACVVGVGRDLERLQLMKSKCSNPAAMFLEQKDLTKDVANLPKYIKELKDKYGKFKGMVCCAGADAPQALQMVDYEKAQNVFDINYFTPLMMMKAFADKRNHLQDSSIVLITSTAAIYPEKGQVIYAATKSALLTSAKVISKELSSKNLRVNCVSPAEIRTPMYEKKIYIYGKSAVDDYPFGIGEPVDVANLVAFLLSEKARWITGQNYILDGGAF